MKNLITLIVVALMAFPVMSQELAESDVPKQVMEAFQAKYPKVVKSVWDQGKKGDFKVRFSVSGDSKSKAIFGPEGDWKRTETKLRASEINEKVQAYIKEHYGSFKLKSVYLIERVGKEAAIQVKMVEPTEEKVKKLVFDSEGKFVKEMAGKKGKAKKG